MQMPFNAPRQPWYIYSEVFQEKDHMGILDKYIAYNELGHHQYTQPSNQRVHPLRHSLSSHPLPYFPNHIITHSLKKSLPHPLPHPLNYPIPNSPTQPLY